MAHRIYLYNQDANTGNSLPTYLGEWNYEVPLLLVPLFSDNLRSESKWLYADKEQGIIQLRYFYDLLGSQFQLTYKKEFAETTAKLFQFLEQLPYDTFVLDATDVFNMNDTPKKQQAQEMVADLTLKWSFFQKAIENQNTSDLDLLLERTGYQSFLEILTTDWVNYGLGYFEMDNYTRASLIVYESEGKLGLRDIHSKLLTEAIYDEIFEWSYSGIAVVAKENLFGYIDQSGKELVPCIYEEALDAVEYEHLIIGQVAANGKMGLIDCKDNELLIPLEMDEMERITYNYYSCLKDGIWRIYSLSTRSFIALESSNIINFDFNTHLFYIQQHQTRLRQFFTEEGIFLGEYTEGALVVLANGYFYTKPNKFQKKTQVIDSKGKVIITEIDQLKTFDNYESFAYKVAGKWHLYSTLSHQEILKDLAKDQFLFTNIHYKLRDYWIIESQSQLGLYNASEDHWLIQLSADIKEIDHIQDDYFFVRKGGKVYYYHQNKMEWSEGFDAILEVFFTPNNITTDHYIGYALQDDALYLISKNGEKFLITEKEYGNADYYRNNLRGENLKNWISFYKRWKDRKGSNYEFVFDTDRIKQLAEEYKENADYSNAIRLYTHTASLGDSDSMVELGIIYTNEEAENTYDVQKGIGWNEAAADLDNAFAWNNLGFYIQNEIGYTYDMNKMLFAYQKAGELGNGLGWANLGDLYYFGNLVTQDYEKALDSYKKAESLSYYNYDKISEILYQQEQFKELIVYLKKDYNNEYANIYFGILYDHGYGVKQHSKKAISYYEKANQNAVYSYAVQRLLYFYGEAPEFKNKNKYDKWLKFAKDNEVEF